MQNDPFQRLGLDREVLSVSQLNQRARGLLEDVFPQVWVEGELSNLARPSSGHVYFTLKDSQAQVRCAFFRQHASRVRQALRDGLAVKVRGKVSVFEGRGDYQLIVDSLEPAGDGALRLAFDALKDKLSAEGLFAQERKQALPKQPKRIGLITSPTGAVIRDLISVFARRAPGIELTVIPTAVQGREAIGQIVRAIQLADKLGFDALVLARGGGSLEDLWCFNEEVVARAITACQTPIVSAVGHETDVTISDFVADLRAPTPSAAAELLAPDQREAQQRIDQLRRQLWLHMNNRLQRENLRLSHLSQRVRHPREQLQRQSQRLDDLELRLQRAWQQALNRSEQRLERAQLRLQAVHPERRLSQYQQRLEHLSQRLPQAIERRLLRHEERLHVLAATLQAVSPLATLGRGYSILLDQQGQAIRSAAQTEPGQRLRARLSHGELQLRIEDNGIAPSTASLLD
ncbi:exodeoxyribonuclease VII large subunit [Atopomonas sediminilitoris]|uniref:exodeoxyribonuclease VII large subunit n=1 Tax=Atopomonas sediminilitoris TaxID=2919919 RepID=UPI001F4EF675|nr:exodeoxyribonuclease VII large subunit [Atopomonas sediminilitoris]MCJ8168974.1 exodeoxyribonuclease VII large subunit [Atopomonas sediminilitoris]